MSRAWVPGILSLLLIPIGASVPLADVQPLTLYERVGRAELVVWAEVTDGEHRFAELRTLEVLECGIRECPGETFRVAYKLDSFLRKPWEDKITFATGDRALLFLRKFTKNDGDRPEGDLYTLMWGLQGKELLPPEGEEAIVAAARRFEDILSTEDLDAQDAKLRATITDPNPWISDGGFEELLEQHLGEIGMIPDLVAMFDSPRQPLRLNAITLLRQIVDDARIAGREIPDRKELSDVIRGRAALDESVEFRVAAVAALGLLGGEEVEPFLKRLAREDSSQLVRYEAEKALMERSLRERSAP